MKRLEVIQNAIADKLEGVSHLRHVYKYNKADAAGFPYATVTPAFMTGEFGDYSAVSKRNLRNFEFLIRVVVDRDEASFGPEKGQRVIIESVDEILTAFDFDVTLSGTVKQVEVVGGDFDFETIGNTVNVANLSVNCLDVVDAR